MKPEVCVLMRAPCACTVFSAVRTLSSATLTHTPYACHGDDAWLQTGYNLLYGCWKYSWDADCELFLKILRGEVKEDVYVEQIQLQVLHLAISTHSGLSDAYVAAQYQAHGLLSMMYHAIYTYIHTHMHIFVEKCYVNVYTYVTINDSNDCIKHIVCIEYGLHMHGTSAIAQQPMAFGMPYAMQHAYT